jgi:glutamate carboxypeptidase
VPDLAELEVDFRFRTLEDGRDLESRIRGLGAVNPEVTLELEGGVHYPPLERTPAVVQVFETARTIAEALGMDLHEVSTGGASEASFAGALGVPTLDGLGGDGDHAHGEDEHVVLSSLAERAALAAGLIRSLATPGTPRSAAAGRTPPTAG